MNVGGMRFDAAVVRGFLLFSRVAGWLLVLVSLVVLIAWISGAGWLVSLVPPQASTRAGAALGCLLAGLALLLGGSGRRAARQASVVLSLVVTALGVVVLAEYVFAIDCAPARVLDGWLPYWPARPSGRMAELAAAGFVLLGVLGALMVSGRAAWLREACALAAIAIAMAGTASYGLVLAGDSAYLLQQLPIQTALMLLLAALGWMSSAPTSGLTRIATADTLGGAFARRLILPALLLPIVLTFALKIVQSHLGMSESLALALAAVATGGTVSAAIVWVAFLLDRVERQRKAVRTLRDDASTDALTGLANRRAFDAALAGALEAREACAQVALLMLDLDHFKAYNDDLGHQAGDHALRETGALLRAALRPGDVAARYGGEEFAILLPDTSAERAARIGERMLEAFRHHDWRDRRVTASIGVAAASTGSDPAALVRLADDALYRSKRGGRDRVSVAV